MILIRRPWTRQPQVYAPVARSSLTVGLKLLTIDGLNVVTGERAAPGSGVTIVRTGRPEGLGFSQAGNGVGLVYSSAFTPVANTGNGVSILVYAAPVSTATIRRALLVGNEAAAAYNQLVIGFNLNASGSATAGVWSALEYNSGFQSRTQSTASMVDGGAHIFVATRPSGTSLWTLYRDGVDCSSTAYSGAGIAMTGGASLLGAPTSTTQPMVDPQFLTAVWDRTLGVHEVAALSRPANLWRLLFAAATLFIPSATAATLPTLTGITLSNITTSGYRATVAGA